MAIDNENKEPFDQLKDLLNKHYKPDQKNDDNAFWESLSKKIDSLFHKEIFSDQLLREDGDPMTDEERYSLGLKEFAANKVNSFKHKEITDHLLICPECRKNYINLIEK